MSSAGRIFKDKTYRLFEELLKKADIQIGGTRPWDMRINADNVFGRVLSRGSLGLGESYMDGAWDVERLDEFFYRLFHSHLDEQVRPVRLAFHVLRTYLFNLQNISRAWQVGIKHYDLGNEFYEAMLDPRMTYSCGYWEDAANLAEAQEAKLEVICKKLQLAPGMRVLDIGCGWGSFMAYAAERYGVHCTGVTVSREQAEWAKKKYKGMPLEFRLQDYRDLNERFDRIVSIGMFEHVGRKNHRIFMKAAHRCLNEEGIFLLQSIGKNRRRSTPDPWIDKYIFPNGDLPSMGQVGDAIDGLFVAEDMHNFGADYDKTLMAWHSNFESAWLQFTDKLDERFYRMWRYYLLSCAGAFRARNIQLWQFCLARNGVPGGCACR